MPSFVQMMALAVKAPTSTTEEVTEDGAEIIAKQAVPWWLGVIQWLASLPSLIGAFLIVGFILFLKWMGEIG